MDILPFVRFEEAYDPFRETPSCSDVLSRRSSTSWPHHSKDPQSTAAAPKLDFVVYNDCYCLFVDLPGLGPEDVQCFVQQVENGCNQLSSVLLIDAGSQSTVVPHLQEGFVSYVLLERSHHREKRSVVFPLNADTDAAVCSLRQGLLTVVVPKRSSPRALAID
jgi:HSP20 family molecular chaperone IbpA